MANKIEQIAIKKKKVAQAKQDLEVARFANKVANEVLENIGDLKNKDHKLLENTISQLAKSIAEAVTVSKESYDIKLEDNFTKLLLATKQNDSNNSIKKLSAEIGKSLAKLENVFNSLELSPQINFTGLTVEQLKKEIDKILSKLPDNAKRDVTIAYEDINPTKYLNVRLTDGFNFYKALGGGGGGASGSKNYTTRIETVGTLTYIGNAVIGSSESAAELYAYEMNYLFTSTGIAQDPQVITATDTANYLVANSYKFKNVTSGPQKELIITGGWLRDSTTGLSITTVDTSGYTIFNAPDHVVAYGTGLQAVLDAQTLPNLLILDKLS